MVHTEQGILKVSIAVTIFVAGFGVVFGLLSGSFSIVFDGVYMLVDASMSGLALIVASLIATNSSPATAVGKLHERFTMGFWHLEPMVLGLNGAMLIGAAIYAMINAIGSLMVGGRDLQFGYAILYAAVALAACIAMAVIETRMNRTIRSDFVALDAKAWIMSAAITGALFGFLWWNASPAQIFMGDTGSLALGGALAGFSILTRTELLAAILGGLFVVIVMSDVIQIGFFKATGRRVLKMAPLHHHFELSGWGEVTIVIRFWIIAGLFVALGVGLFYGEWVAG